MFLPLVRTKNLVARIDRVFNETLGQLEPLITEKPPSEFVKLQHLDVRCIGVRVAMNEWSTHVKMRTDGAIVWYYMFEPTAGGLMVATNDDVDRYELLHAQNQSLMSLTKLDVKHICTLHKFNPESCMCRLFRSEGECMASFALAVREGDIKLRPMENSDGAPKGKPRRRRGHGPRTRRDQGGSAAFCISCGKQWTSLSWSNYKQHVSSASCKKARDLTQCELAAAEGAALTIYRRGLEIALTPTDLTDLETGNPIDSNFLTGVS